MSLKLGDSESRTGPTISEGLRGVLDELATQEYRLVIQYLRFGARQAGESPLAGFHHDPIRTIVLGLEQEEAL